MAFITQPDPIAAKDALINEQSAKIRLLEAQLNMAVAEAEAAQNTIEEIADECPECADLCALDQECEDARCDVLDAQNFLNQELCGNKWPTKLTHKCLNAELYLMQEIAQALICERDYKLAIAAHNAAYCRHLGTPEFIDSKKMELMALIEGKDIDPRCRAFINKFLAMVCA